MERDTSQASHAHCGRNRDQQDNVDDAAQQGVRIQVQAGDPCKARQRRGREREKPDGEPEHEKPMRNPHSP